MSGTADMLEGFANDLNHYVEEIESLDREIRVIVAHLGEHFEGRLYDAFEMAFHEEIHAPIVPLTGDLHTMHAGLSADIEFVRRLESGSVTV